MPKDPDLPLGKTFGRDRETTTPEAAAQYEADRTPYYDERLDEYEPDRPGFDRTLDVFVHDQRRYLEAKERGEIA